MPARARTTRARAAKSPAAARSRIARRAPATPARARAARRTTAAAASSSVRTRARTRRRCRKKMRRLAMRSVLSARAAEDAITIVDAFTLDEPQDEDAAGHAGHAGRRSTARWSCWPSAATALLRAARNLDRVHVVTPNGPEPARHPAAAAADPDRAAVEELTRTLTADLPVKPARRRRRPANDARCVQHHRPPGRLREEHRARRRGQVRLRSRARRPTRSRSSTPSKRRSPTRRSRSPRSTSCTCRASNAAAAIGRHDALLEKSHCHSEGRPAARPLRGCVECQSRPTSQPRLVDAGCPCRPSTRSPRPSPRRSLTEPLKKTAGRNNNGRITTRHRGGGHKRMYRIIDWKRNKIGVAGRVIAIEYDPNRSARIALHPVRGRRAALHPCARSACASARACPRAPRRTWRLAMRWRLRDIPGRLDHPQHRAEARARRADGARRRRRRAVDGQGRRLGAGAPAVRRGAARARRVHGHPRPGRQPRARHDQHRQGRPHAPHGHPARRCAARP